MTLQNKAEKICWDIFLNMIKSNAHFISYALVATLKEEKNLTKVYNLPNTIYSYTKYHGTIYLTAINVKGIYLII